MKADCHIHMVLDAVDWKKAMARHRVQPDEGYIRQVLETYRDLGYTYLRDGGDKHSASVRARELAGQYGITYRSPIAPICLAGHYGSFIGCPVADLGEYARLVKKFRRDGADFIKIMISGLMDFDRFGALTEEGLAPKTIGEMIRIAHAEGLSVMAHANGARVMEAAAIAGVDSIEHGAYADDAALQAMAENQVVWVPTLSTIGELRTDSSTPLRSAQNDRKVGAAQAILERALENVAKFVAIGGLVAPGTDAGAFAVPHGCGTEEGYLRAAGVSDEQMEMGVKAIMEKF